MDKYSEKVTPPDLPKYQDCHFMWSKKKRRGERGIAQGGGAGGDPSQGRPRILSLAC